MNIHEYQAKEIFRRYGIPTPKGIPAFDVAAVTEGAKKLIAEAFGGSVVATLLGSQAVILRSTTLAFSPPYFRRLSAR